MKFFSKKRGRSANPSTKPQVPDSEDSFYSQHVGESPLDAYSDVRRQQATRRTSRHSPAQRRENSNQVSHWALTVLFLRTGLIVLLLVGGFLVLKLVLGRLGKPSEKEKQQWDVNAARMEQATSSDAESAGGAVSPELVVSPMLMTQRLEQWEQTERLLRSAEALSLRGINDEAAKRLSQALRITPENRSAQKLLVDIYIKMGLYAEAVPLCIHLLDQNGPQEELQMNLLRTLQASGQIDASLVLAERMLKDQPNNEFALSVAAAGQAARGTTEGALAMFERMLENSATNRVALERCGEIYSGRGDYEKAASYYSELVRLHPEPDYYQRLAHCYAQQNQAGKSVVFMGQAASLFGTAAVAPWLKDSVFDPVRETVEFRSFADRVVGVETRKAIEAISKREAEKVTPAIPGGLELPQQPELNAIRSGK